MRERKRGLPGSLVVTDCSVSRSCWFCGLVTDCRLRCGTPARSGSLWNLNGWAGTLKNVAAIVDGVPPNDEYGTFFSVSGLQPTSPAQCTSLPDRQLHCSCLGYTSASTMQLITAPDSLTQTGVKTGVGKSVAAFEAYLSTSTGT